MVRHFVWLRYMQHNLVLACSCQFPVLRPYYCLGSSVNLNSQYDHSVCAKSPNSEHFLCLRTSGNSQSPCLMIFLSHSFRIGNSLILYLRRLVCRLWLLGLFCCLLLGTCRPPCPIFPGRLNYFSALVRAKHPQVLMSS